MLACEVSLLFAFLINIYLSVSIICVYCSKYGWFSMRAYTLVRSRW